MAPATRSESGGDLLHPLFRSAAWNERGLPLHGDKDELRDGERQGAVELPKEQDSHDPDDSSPATTCF